MAIEPISARHLIKYFWDAQRYLGREGRWSVDPIHADIIEAVMQKIDQDVANTVRRQVDHRYFFAWMSDGRINVFYFYDVKKIPLIADPEFANKLYRIELFIDGKRHVAQVTFYMGRIFSVELKIPRKSYKDKEYRVGVVTEGQPKDSFTKVIDRAAHGRATETNP